MAQSYDRAMPFRGTPQRKVCSNPILRLSVVTFSHLNVITFNVFITGAPLPSPSPLPNGWLASTRWHLAHSWHLACSVNIECASDSPIWLFSALHFRKKRSWDKKIKHHSDLSHRKLLTIKDEWKQHNRQGLRPKSGVISSPHAHHAGRRYVCSSRWHHHQHLPERPACYAQFKVPVGVSQHLGLRGQRLEMLGQRDLPTVPTSSYKWPNAHRH